MAQVMIEHVKKRGRIETVASGMENLPTEGGYIMFANHQGKYDALGVISVHEKAMHICNGCEAITFVYRHAVV